MPKQNTAPQTRIRRYQKKSYSANIPEIYQIKQYRSSELTNNDQNTGIATHTPTRKLRPNSYTRLVKAIRDKQLSDSLDYLENFGYCSSEDAIRKIAYLQWEGIC